MKVGEIMTPNPACCTPETPLLQVAQMFIDHDCGAIPVIESESVRKPVGIVTDRDIACRTVAAGKNALELRGPRLHVLALRRGDARDGLERLLRGDGEEQGPTRAGHRQLRRFMRNHFAGGHRPSGQGEHDRGSRPRGLPAVAFRVRGGLTVAFACIGICALGRTGDRLATRGSTAHLIPSLRSGPERRETSLPAASRPIDFLAPGPKAFRRFALFRLRQISLRNRVVGAFDIPDHRRDPPALAVLQELDRVDAAYEGLGVGLGAWRDS